MCVCKGCAFEFGWTQQTTTIPNECIECQVVDGKPSSYKPKPQTNADRIRAMSDEQLIGIVHAVYLSEDCPFSSADCENCLFRKICEGNYKTESEWLKQPAEGE